MGGSSNTARQGKSKPPSVTIRFSCEIVQVLALELLTNVGLANADRCSIIWPLVYKHFHELLSNASDEPEPSFMTERVVVNLLRFCIALLHREEITSDLLGSIRLLRDLPPPHLDALAGRIMAGMLIALKTNAAVIRTREEWQVCKHTQSCASARILPCCTPHLHAHTHMHTCRRFANCSTSF